MEKATSDRMKSLCDNENHADAFTSGYYFARDWLFDHPGTDADEAMGLLTGYMTDLAGDEAEIAYEGALCAVKEGRS